MKTHSIENEKCCDSEKSVSETANQPADILENGILDVRKLPPGRRHFLIFQTFDNLRAGESFVLVNDHDPRPLFHQFAYERPRGVSWIYEEQGPAVWRVRIGKK
ncbi:MAG TPA: DUF2249 domain-containing protein [Verrucomicrobiae bacterium]|jgi:uncharacterized protein (DUF2249 family)|nr:DUF2249 domain-containing protein [Verrucomicrobiae bacterium]